MAEQRNESASSCVLDLENWNLFDREKKIERNQI